MIDCMEIIYEVCVVVLDYSLGSNATATFIFFFKQKTAYELRISDWSSDVCSSDLTRCQQLAAMQRALQHQSAGGIADRRIQLHPRRQALAGNHAIRSEERSVGNASVSTCSSGCSTYL